MSYFENEAVVFERFELLLPKTVEDLMGKDRLDILRRDYEKLTELARKIDSHLSKNAKNNRLFEYAGIAKTVAEGLKTVNNAIESLENLEPVDISLTASAVTHLYACLYGMQRQLEMSGEFF